MKILIGAIAIVSLLWLGASNASAWKCNVHPEKPDCTPVTTVPTTVPETTTTTPVTVPETTTTTTTVSVPELAPPVSIVRPDTPIRLAG